MTDRYPLVSGHRGDAASMANAHLVDSDGDRKLAFFVNAVIALLRSEDSMCPDDMVTAANETTLYGRPLITTLTKLNTINKTGRLKTSLVHQRPANVMIPSDLLLDFIVQHDPETEDDFKRVIAAFILSQIAAEREAQRVLRNAA